ncbi:ferredoxin [Kribbella sp. NPDC023855]|uniref:ferredoxin n=1 Tax=Kribbella sp. NPDC023855 TaxID=3154698 RepID=UPI0033C7CB16
MRIEVDRATCENHGQCVFAAPEVFAFDDDEQLTYDAHPATGLAEAVRAAAAACPVRAITLVEQ